MAETSPLDNLLFGTNVLLYYTTTGITGKRRDSSTSSFPSLGLDGFRWKQYECPLNTEVRIYNTSLHEGGLSPRREGRITSIWHFVSLFPRLHICSNLKFLGALLRTAARGALATGQRRLSLFSFDIRRLIFSSRLFGKFISPLPVDVSSVICETDQSYRFRKKYISMSSCGHSHRKHTGTQSLLYVRIFLYG